MKFARLAFLTVVLLLHFQSIASAATTCNAAKLAQVRATATATDYQVWVSCNLNLTSSDIITKTIRIRGAAANDITIDCNGAKLDGAGTPSASQERIRVDSEIHGGASFGTCTRDSTGNYCEYDRPENVTVRDCDTPRAIGTTPSSTISRSHLESIGRPIATIPLR